MQAYSTAGMDPSVKASFWNGVFHDTFAVAETIPYSPVDFNGTINVATVGSFTLGKVAASARRVRHTSQHVNRTTDHRYYLHLQLNDHLRVTQDGRTAEAGAGDFILVESGSPSTLDYGGNSTTLVLAAPIEAFRTRIPSPELLLCVPLTGRSGLAHTAAVMLQSLWFRVDEGCPEALAARVADYVLDVLATSYSSYRQVIVANSAVASARRLKIRHYIEANLSDPELTPRMIAGVFRISPRYLHMLFVPEGETVSNYISRRRVEECAKRITDVLWQGHTITDIAFRFGFNSATHFARVFRDHYGLSPRDYRKANLAPVPEPVLSPR
jgi:AraC-like DNA-binding protein